MLTAQKVYTGIKNGPATPGRAHALQPFRPRAHAHQHRGHHEPQAANHTARLTARPAATIAQDKHPPILIDATPLRRTNRTTHAPIRTETRPRTVTFRPNRRWPIR